MLVHAHELMEMVPAPAQGRVFTGRTRAGLSDCAPSGRARLDALARWLQDVAYADVEDAGLAELAVWVVRRTRIRVNRFPRFGEHFELRTFCSGLGRMWAERRTTITREGSGESDVETVALWVHLDPESWRPAPFSAEEVAGYGADAGGGRRISARLRHPAKPAGDQHTPWTFRATECDIADHVNNAAYWQPFEEELLRGPEPRLVDVEMEWRTPAQPGGKTIVGDGARRWIVGDDGETNASILIAALEA